MGCYILYNDYTFITTSVFDIGKQLVFKLSPRADYIYVDSIYAHFVCFYVYTCTPCIFVGESHVSEMHVGYPE